MDCDGINSDRWGKNWRNYMHQPQAMLQCGRQYYADDALAGTRGKGFSAFCFFLHSFLFIGGFDSRASTPVFQRSHNVVVIYFFMFPFFSIVGSCVSPVCLCLRAIWAEPQNAWKPLCSEVGTTCWLQSPVRMAKLGNKRPLYESIHLTFVKIFREDFTRPVASVLIWQIHNSLVSLWLPF